MLSYVKGMRFGCIRHRTNEKQDRSFRFHSSFDKESRLLSDPETGSNTKRALCRPTFFFGGKIVIIPFFFIYLNLLFI